MEKLYSSCNRLIVQRSTVLMLIFFLGTFFTSIGQTLVWEENFDGETIDPETWTFDFGDGCERGNCGWGNSELEYYTSRPENARIENSNLLIEARKEDFLGKPFTSARLKTFGRVQFKYGTLEARIKISDLENGLWPAFWMLGASGVWPASGEIDILEMGSAEAISNGVINRQVGAAVHWEHQDQHASYDTKYISETDLTDEYHIYKLVWDKDFIKVYIDDNEFYAIDISGGEGSDLEEFHKSHYILLNLAVGGNYTGIHSAAGVTAPLPGRMYVDYIKLYQDPADGGSLYLGKNNAITGNFGIFTETTSVSAELTYEEDANLFIWNNLNVIEGAASYEGEELWAFQAVSGQWFGFGIENQPINLLNFAEEGTLNFNMKTSYGGQFKVGVLTGHGESWINFAPGESAYGLQRDGAWHEVSIPLSAFHNPEMGMNVDWGSVAQAFMFAGDLATGNADFFIDNIYYGGGVASSPSPKVSITAPAKEALLPSLETISIEATASIEEGTIEKIDFYQGNFLLGTDETSPYRFDWEAVPAGVYNLTARATSGDGIVTTSETVQVFVSPINNEVPTVNITSPADNSAYMMPATINLTADAQDADGSIYKVEFYNGDELLGTDFSSPYSFEWKNVEAGPYKITAKATDSGKLSSTSAVVHVEIVSNSIISDNYGIYTEDASIASHLTYGEDAALLLWNGMTALAEVAPYEGNEAWGFDVEAGNWFGFGVDNSLRNLSHFEEGALKLQLKTSYTGAFSIGIKSIEESWIDFLPGMEQYGLIRDGEWHELTIPLRDFPALDLSAVDQAFMFVGDAPSEGTTFYFDHIYYSATPVNSAPTASITSPEANKGFDAPADVTIEAIASDKNGNITKVEFYNGEDLLGTSENSPYTFLWADVPVGSYTLTAKAYDDEDAITTSAPIVINVVDPSANGTNLALNKPVTVSSLENEETPGAAAVDGSLTTRWSSAFEDPQWLYVDLGTTYDINRIKITWEPAFATDYLVQVSSDAKDWEDVKTINNNASLENDHQGLSINGRYVRIYGTKRATVYGYSIFELEVYGSGDGVTEPEPTTPAGYCGTAENGDYSYRAETDGDKVTYTFYPEAPIEGSSMAIIYIREGSEGAYPGYNMSQTTSGDFTFTKEIAEGVETSIYFAYAVPSGGERNSSENPHSYTAGDICWNTAPTVSLISPSSDKHFDAPANILLEAEASDAEGSIAKVAFYEGENLLHTDESSPYSFTWTGVGEGTYQIYAVAFDDEGLSSNSEVVEITVLEVVTGLENNIEESGVVIYPNPTAGKVKISFLDQKGEFELALYDVQGSLVKSLAKGRIETKGGTFEFDVRDLKPGIYLLHFQTEKGRLVKSLIIQH